MSKEYAMKSDKEFVMNKFKGCLKYFSIVVLSVILLVFTYGPQW